MSDNEHFITEFSAQTERVFALLRENEGLRTENQGSVYKENIELKKKIRELQNQLDGWGDINSASDDISVISYYVKELEYEHFAEIYKEKLDELDIEYDEDDLGICKRGKVPGSGGVEEEVINNDPELKEHIFMVACRLEDLG